MCSVLKYVVSGGLPHLRQLTGKATTDETGPDVDNIAARLEGEVWSHGI